MKFIPILLSLASLILSFASEAQEDNTSPKHKISSRLLAENDQFGRTVKITFLNENLKPTTQGSLNSQLEKLTLGAHGFSSVSLEYDGDGAEEIPARWRFFDTSGNETTTSEGFSRMEILVTDAGNLSEIRYLDNTENLVNTKEGFAIVKRTYDGTNNITSEAFFDKDDKLALNKKRGYAAMIINYIKNEKEEYEERQFKDPQGNSLPIDGAYKHVQGIVKRDELMNVIKSYNNLDDSLVNGPDGYALHITRPLLSQKNPKEAYLNAQSELVNGPEGFAQLQQSKDEDSGTNKLQYLNAKGEPVNHPTLQWSYHIFQLSDKGEIMNSTYYDKDGKEIIRK